MLHVGTVVKFSDQYQPRENDREGKVIANCGQIYTVRWSALSLAFESYVGHYEAWQLQEVSK